MHQEAVAGESLVQSITSIGAGMLLCVDQGKLTSDLGIDGSQVDVSGVEGDGARGGGRLCDS